MNNPDTAIERKEHLSNLITMIVKRYDCKTASELRKMVNAAKGKHAPFSGTEVLSSVRYLVATKIIYKKFFRECSVGGDICPVFSIKNKRG